ncbi:MAG: DoxX family protein [Alphaproteobacteria bacterium]|jgi:putative oxidoreductase
MFHADHNFLQMLAHAMIAFLFIFRGFTALPRFNEHARRLAKRGVPFSPFSLAAGFLMMLAGGTSILIDYYTQIGASILIAFTILANFLYHDFWNKKGDWAERNRAIYTFCNNIAVMGGLLMILVTS